jgi:hypothetical protein
MVDRNERLIRITVGLPVREHAELSVIAERNRTSLSWIVARAVAEFLERTREGQAELPLTIGTSRLLENG